MPSERLPVGFIVEAGPAWNWACSLLRHRQESLMVCMDFFVWNHIAWPCDRLRNICPTASKHALQLSCAEYILHILYSILQIGNILCIPSPEDRGAHVHTCLGFYEEGEGS